MVIWKITIEKNRNTIEIPKGAKILSIQNQFERVAIWFLCDSEAEKERRHFVAVPTGEEFGEVKGEYLGTAMLKGGALVIHMFEVKE